MPGQPYVAAGRERARPLRVVGHLGSLLPVRGPLSPKIHSGSQHSA
ncbi:hypothetical protein BN2364_2214 [Alloalcanivorax xenomutans]|nr:hypothetical protein BN2364_2214 [Alloalcanivorax xenomutans]